MGHDREPSESLTTVIFILILGGTLLLGGAGVGLLFWMSMSRRADALAVAQRERAVAEMLCAESVARSQLETDQQMKMQSNSTSNNRSVSLELNETGETLLDGQKLSLPQVQQLLQTSDAEAIDLTIHPKCTFQHVIELRAACVSSGVTKFRIIGLE